MHDPDKPGGPVFSDEKFGIVQESYDVSPERACDLN